jgi:hypothetical protein
LTFPFVIALVLLRDQNFNVSLRYLWPYLISASFFFMGVMRMLYAWLFADPIPESPTAMPPAPIVANRPVPALPGAYHATVVRAEVPNTSNVNQPSSVTEPTTNLLGKQ